jgi:hypothetical protein
MPDISRYVSSHINISFQDYIERGAEIDVDGVRYFPGAVLCDMVYLAAGADGIGALFRTGRSDADLYAVIEQTLGLSRAAFAQAWQDRILRFQ